MEKLEMTRQQARMQINYRLMTRILQLSQNLITNTKKANKCTTFCRKLYT